MKSVMTSQQMFARAPGHRVPRASFNRSHGYKTTFDAGKLIPFYIDEVLPGDSFNLKANAFARLATPINPIMDNMFMETFFFFVPNRLVWDNWTKFMGEQQDPGDSIDYLVPTMQRTGASLVQEGWIGDYFGIPTNFELTDVSALPFRAYNLIWNEWFRDQNLQDSVVINKGDGPDIVDSSVTLPKPRGKRHDYFTSCLPWPQKGGDPVSMPLGTTAPLTTVSGLSTPGQFNTLSDTQFLPATDQGLGVGGTGGGKNGRLETDSGTALYYDPNGTLEADLSNATRRR